MSEPITKKTRVSKVAKTRTSDDMLKEYRFDYSKARPNRFAARAKHPLPRMGRPDHKPGQDADHAQPQ